jgi:hypothetical protein
LKKKQEEELKKKQQEEEDIIEVEEKAFEVANKEKLEEENKVIA